MSRGGSALAPAKATARVEMLKGHDYLRIWLYRDGIHY